MNDIQIPFHDEKVLDLVVDFVRDLKPHGVILNGDIVDCYAISTYSKDPMEKSDIVLEQRYARELMNKLAPVTKERWWLGGNHEDRLRRYIWNNAKEFAGLEEMTFPKLFRLGDYGFKWKEYGGSLNLGKLMVTHGSLVSKHAGWTAKLHMEKYGTSVLVGHSHRMGTYYKRDVRGEHVAVDNGCLCQLNPEYDQFPNWQQCFSVVNAADNGFFNVIQVPILDRKCFFYGGTMVGTR